MATLRVLIVDDSFVMRRILQDVMSADPEILVVGSATNGREAIARIVELKPDLITLDVEMPEMDGLATLAALRQMDCRIPVIMCSTLTGRGAAITVEALTLGARDYVTKPGRVASKEAAVAALREELLPKIRALCGGRRPVGARAPRTLAHAGTSPVAAVAIGTSTGGPEALAYLFAHFRRPLEVPLFVVQHMPPVFTALLATRLSTLGPNVVREAVDGVVVEPGQCWIAQGGRHLRVVKDGTKVRLRLGDDTPRNGCRPAVDHLFESIADVYGANALGVVLTGMGADGRDGAGCLRQRGADVVVQDEATSVIWGMPKAVYEIGAAVDVLNLDELATLIMARAAPRERQARQGVG